MKILHQAPLCSQYRRTPIRPSANAWAASSGSKGLLAASTQESERGGSEVARIVVCGYMVRHPLGGNILAYFHYVLGFHRLGHEVVYLEESGWSNSCFDPVKRDYGDDPRAGLHVVRALFAAYGLDVPVIY